MLILCISVADNRLKNACLITILIPLLRFSECNILFNSGFHCVHFLQHKRFTGIFMFCHLAGHT